MAAPASDIRARFGHAVREVRHRQGLTQEELAERSGLSYKFVGEVERGRGNPTLTTMARLASALGVGLDTLIDSPDPPKVQTPEYTVSKRDLQAARESLATVAMIFSQISSPSYRRRRRSNPKK